MPKITFRLLLAVLYLGVLLYGGGYLLQWVQSFSGVIIVEKGRTEQWVTRPAEGGGSFSTPHRNMPAEVISFNNRRAAVHILGTNDQFDAASLPFQLKLTGIEILEQCPDEESLEVIFPGEKFTVKVKQDKKITIPEGTIVIRGMKPWRGLFRDGRGEAMATVSLKSDNGSWSPAVFIDTKTTVRPRPHLAISLRWFPDEKQAEVPLPADAILASQTRWGIKDTKCIHWFNSLMPGTGITTSNNTKYILLDVVSGNTKDSPPITAIVVGQTAGNKKNTLRINANQSEEEDIVLLESHYDSNAVRLHGWHDGSVMALVYHQGIHQKSTVLKERDTLKIKMGEELLLLRLDQVMHTAIPIFGENSVALVLETPSGEIQLREGQGIQLKESHLRFRRLPHPSLIRYTFQTIETSPNKKTHSFSLSPGESRHIGKWYFTNDIEHLENETIAVLHAQRVPGTPSQYLGGLLFLVGAIGLLIFRFANWNSISHEDAGKIFDADKWTAIPPENDISNPAHED
ncbi:MAG: hypothetical protein KAH38_12910 [Candidatus Hydrogenedentes bacterium]|nr:hypothetical protein [Candidatus Hydrogenedentota bacterium]